MNGQVGKVTGGVNGRGQSKRGRDGNTKIILLYAEAE